MKAVFKSWDKRQKSSRWPQAHATTGNANKADEKPTAQIVRHEFDTGTAKRHLHAVLLRLPPLQVVLVAG